MTFDVDAEAHCRTTGLFMGRRTERVSTTDPLFAGCTTTAQVKQRYEEFWNDIGPPTPAEVVRVRAVRQVSA